LAVIIVRLFVALIVYKL